MLFKSVPAESSRLVVTASLASEPLLQASFLIVRDTGLAPEQEIVVSAIDAVVVEVIEA